MELSACVFSMGVAAEAALLAVPAVMAGTKAGAEGAVVSSAR